MAMITTTSLLKFRRLVSQLGMSGPHVLGHLEYLWQYCHAHAKTIDGVLFEPGDVELISEWAGEKGVFVKALLENGWLDKLDSGHVVIHDYKDHIPPFVRDRFRMQLKRAYQNTEDKLSEPFANGSRTIRERFDIGEDRRGEDRRDEDKKAEPSVEEAKQVGSADSCLTFGDGGADAKTPARDGNVVCSVPHGQVAAKQVRVPEHHREETSVDAIISRIMAAGSGHDCPGAEWWRGVLEGGKLLPVVNAAISRIEAGKEPFARLQCLVESMMGCNYGEVRAAGHDTVPTEIREVAATVLGKASSDAACNRGNSHTKQVAYILEITGEPEPYRAWWGDVVQRMRRTDGMEILGEAARYAKDCGDPHARQAKGLGPLEHPGRYIASKCKEHLERNNVTLPPRPAVRVKRAVNGEKR